MLIFIFLMLILVLCCVLLGYVFCGIVEEKRQLELINKVPEVKPFCEKKQTKKQPINFNISNDLDFPPCEKV